MERHSLRIVVVLGVLVTLLGGTGIFAVFADRSTTGTASVTSGERQRAADLKIALADAAVGGGVNCDPDADGIVGVDDLVSPLFTATDVQPGQTAGVVYLCMVNAGSGSLDATATVIDLTDIDDGCTGDEAAAGDTTCDALNPVGELSPLLLIDFELLGCQPVGGTTQIISGFTDIPAAYAATPWNFTATPLAAGDTACLRAIVRYRSDVTESEAQQAQTDTVTLRFAFDATAS